uniref:RNA-dependent RNA polymerase n=1 Tax=Beihai sesarmid crab virus 5 TaxID=1922665 RepID=A0A1L3KPJ0_9VIRU|nr:RNA-dependent RNA polymerase [Beihai sesarmid crab virus 5]
MNNKNRFENLDVLDVEDVTDIESDSQASEEEVESASISMDNRPIDLEISILCDNANPQQLLCYINDCYSMLPADGFLTMDIFRSVHKNMINILENLAENGQTLPAYFIKSYFKFRHDIFSRICLSSIGVNVSLGTDMKLEKYLLGSKKTPDYILETNGKLYIIEFTVSRRQDTVDYNKGGLLYEQKYLRESIEIKNNTSLDVNLIIIPAILNDNNVENIVNSILKIKEDLTEEDLRDLRSCLADFFCVSNTGQYLINSSAIVLNETLNQMPKHVLEVYNKFNLNLKKTFKQFPRPNLFKVKMLNLDLISRFLESVDDLKKSLTLAIEDNLKRMKYKGKRTTTKIRILFDIKRPKLLMIWNKQVKGVDLTLNEWLEFAKQPDPTWLGSKISVKDGNRYLTQKEFSGTIPVTIRNKYTLKQDNNDNDKIKFDNKPTSCSYVYSNVKNSRLWVLEAPELFNKKDLIYLTENSGVAFPNDYLDKLKSIADYPKREGMLVNEKVGKIDPEKLSENLSIKFKEINTQEKFVWNPKRTFVFPLVTGELEYQNLGCNDKSFIELISERMNLSYTSTILKNYSKNVGMKREFVTKMNLNKFNESQTWLREKQKELNLKKRKEILKTKFESEARKHMKNISEYYRSLTPKQDQIKNIVRLKLNKNSSISQKFEMKHYGLKGFHGVGNVDDETLLRFDKWFKTLMKRLVNPDSIEIQDFLYHKERGPGEEFLTLLKDMHTKSWDEFYDTYKKTKLAHSAEFVSRLCFSLYKESTKNYSSDYCKVDMMGYKNCFYMVRGGKKLTNTDKSRLFRICFPINKLDTEFSGFRGNSDYSIFTINDMEYILTPWMQYSVDLLNDGITLPYRIFMNLYSYCKRTNKSFDSITNEQMFAVMLAFHNKRPTNNFMHNTRYLLVNTLGKYSCLEKLLKEFVGFNYTYLEAWLRFKIIKNYRKHYNEFRKLRDKSLGNDLSIIMKDLNISHLWTDGRLCNPDDLTNLIYSTYLMTRSNVESTISNIKNLTNILTDISIYKKENDDMHLLNCESAYFDVLNIKNDETSDAILNKDMSFDPIFCQFLGHYAASCLSRTMKIQQLQSVWESIINRNYDDMANAKGLRGMTKDTLWGEKGYEVVYHEQNNDESLKEMLDRYEEVGKDMKTLTHLVREERDTYRSMINENPLERAIFGLGFKKQRGGEREIYIMDKITKLYQQPLEKFFAYLCKQFPGEYISMNSSKRAGEIHHDFFERSPGKKFPVSYRWVLDCRRWGPHSVFQKYVHFIKGMEPFLPKSFVQLFFYMSEKMLNKCILVRNNLFEKVINNQCLSEEEFESLDYEIGENGKIIKMPFSFIMGIFNYLSSLMHVVNQLVASEVIRDRSIMKGKGMVLLEMKAHSDDSAGKSYHQNKKSIDDTVTTYEWLLKGANHMLSTKKCQINENVYFEFLSILYLKDRLLPLIPKFSSSLSFTPTDKGYSADVTTSISQSIELMSYGGTFEESFLITKLSERFITRFYGLIPTYDRPYQFLGGIDSHPLELVLAGANCEIIKFMRYKEEVFNKHYEFLLDGKFISDTSPEDLHLMWDMGVKMSNKLRKRHEAEICSIQSNKLYQSWTLMNSKLGNTNLNKLWYLNKLSNPSFYSSVSNEPVSKRLVHIYNASNIRNIIRNDGQRVPVCELQHLLTAYQKSNVKSKNFVKDLMPYYKCLSEELISFWDSLPKDMSYKLEANFIKAKPTFISVNIPTVVGLQLGATTYVTCLREPEFVPYLGLRGDPTNLCMLLSKKLANLGLNLNELTNQQLCQIARKVLGVELRQFHMITHNKSLNRRIDNYTGMINWLKTNSIYNKCIQFEEGNAKRVDLKTKFVHSHIPSDVAEAVKIFWLWRLSERFNISDNKFWKNNLEETAKLKLNKVPYEWHSLTDSLRLNEKMMLSSINYWKCWFKEQTKVGYDWMGEGVLYVKLPEVELEFVKKGLSLKEVRLENSLRGFYSKPSSWFLSNFTFRDEDLLQHTSPPEFSDPNIMVLGFDGRTHLWGYDLPKRFTRVIKSTLDIGLSYKHMTMMSITVKDVGYKLMFNLKGKNYRLETLLQTETFQGLGLRKYANMKELKKALAQNHPGVNKFVHYCSDELGIIYKYDKSLLKRNFDHSVTCNVVVNDINDSLKRSEDINYIKQLPIAYLKYKKLRPDFGFPTEDEIKSMLEDDDVPDLPPPIADAISKLFPDAMTKEEVLKMSNLLRSPKSLNEKVRDIIGNFGVGTSLNHLISTLDLDQTLLKSCKVLTRSQPVWNLIGNVFHSVRDYLFDFDHSQTLRQEMRLTGVDKIETWTSMFTTYITLALNMKADYCEDFEIGRLVISVIRELLNAGFIQYLNDNRAFYEMFRLTEFPDDVELVLNMFIDILDSIAYLNWPKYQFLDQEILRKTFQGMPKGLLSKVLSQHKRLNNIKLNVVIKSITNQPDKGLRKNVEYSGEIPLLSPIPSCDLRKWSKMTNESMREAFFEFSSGEDLVSEDYEFEEGGLCVAMVINNIQTDRDILASRGTAAAVLNISGDRYDNNNTSSFCKNIKFKNIKFDRDNYLLSKINIVCVSQYGLYVNVPGMFNVRTSINTKEILGDRYVEVNGKKLTKKEFFKLKDMEGNLLNLKGFWEVLTSDAKRKVEEVVEISKDIIKDQEHPKVKYYRELLNKMLDSVELVDKMDKEGNMSLKEVIAQLMPTMKDYLKNYNLDNYILTDENKTQILNTRRTMRSLQANNSNMPQSDILTDPRAKGELNTIAPGYSSRLFTHKIKLTKTQINTLNMCTQMAVVKSSNRPQECNVARCIQESIKYIIGMCDLTKDVESSDTMLFSKLLEFVSDEDNLAETSDSNLIPGDPDSMSLHPDIADIINNIG